MSSRMAARRGCEVLGAEGDLLGGFGELRIIADAFEHLPLALHEADDLVIAMALVAGVAEEDGDDLQDGPEAYR